MLLDVTNARLIEALEQSTGVGRRAQQVGRLLQRSVVVDGDQHRVAALGRDLDRHAVLVHLLDQGKQVLPRFAGGDGHDGLPLSDWYEKWYHAVLDP